MRTSSRSSASSASFCVAGSRAIVGLPATQEEALDALEADAVLTRALGPVLAESYLAVRRSEWAAYSAGDAAFEQQGHFEKY